MKNSRFRNPYRSRIEQVVLYITENLSGQLDLAQVARAGHFSPYHFHRIFTAGLGETPQDFVNRLRLEKAANLLFKSPSMTITQIAFACGFSSPSTFARSFKKHFGVTASKYASCSPAGSSTGSTTVQPAGTYPAIPAIPALTPRLEIRVREMPELHVAYVATMKGYNLAEICLAWERLSRWASAHGLLTPAAQMIGISLDDPLITPKSKCRYYACITVPAEMTSDQVVGFLDIPASKCAVCRLVGSGEQIELAYRSFYRDWLPDSGMQPADYPCYEIYHATPDTNPDGCYIMDICIPIIPV